MSGGIFLTGAGSFIGGALIGQAGGAVVAGTSAEYDWLDPALEQGRCGETTTPLLPRSLLGRSKLALGRWLTEEADLAAVHARIFFAYGSHETPGRLVPSLIGRLLAGEPAETGPGELVRDFLDGRDIAGALVAPAAGAVVGVVNVGRGEGVAIADLAGEIARQIGRPELLRVGALPPRAGEPPRLVADTTRLGREVGFEPAIALADGLGDAIAWWRGRLRIEG